MMGDAIIGCLANGGLKKARLKVNKIPETLTLADLTILFSQCGDPTFGSLIRDPHSHFLSATVEYAKLSEAIAAIEILNNQPPLNLKLELEVEAQQLPDSWDVENVDKTLDPMAQALSVYSNGKMGASAPMLNPDYLQGYCRALRDLNSSPHLYPMLLASMPSGIPGIEQNISSHNNPRVSNGRAAVCITSELEISNGICTNGNKNNGELEKPLPERPVDRQSYQSNTYQRPVHKSAGAPTPRREPHRTRHDLHHTPNDHHQTRKDFHHTRNDHHQARNSFQFKSKKFDHHKTSNDRYHTRNDPHQARNDFHHNRNDIRKAQPNTLQHHKEELSVCTTGRWAVERTGSSQKPVSPHQSRDDIEKAQSNTLNHRIEPGLVKQVKVVDGMKNDYWVHLVDDLPALSKLSLELNKRINDSSPGFTNLPQPGDWCCKKYDGNWTRARISSEPRSIIYVDYGNCEEFTLDQLKVLPDDLINDLPYAIHVYDPQGLSSTDLSSLTLHFVSVDPASVWTVERASTSQKPVSLQNPVTPTQSRNDIERSKTSKYRIEVGSVKKVEVVYGMKNDYWVNLIDDSPALSKLSLELDKRISDSSPGFTNPLHPGDWCCKQYDGHWTRARISSEPRSIIYVDYGNCEEFTLDQLKVLPKDLTSDLPYAIHVYDPQGLSSTEISSLTLSFISVDAAGRWTVERAASKVNTSAVSELTGSCSSLDTNGGNQSDESRISSTEQQNTSETASTQIQQNQQIPKKAIRIPFFKIGDIVSVRIQHADNASDLYATKVDSLQELDKMQEDLNAVISDRSHPLKNVAVNAKVAAKYEGMWYRGKLVSVNPLKVRYIDYGNVETRDLGDIKELPDVFAKKGLLTTLVHCSTPLSKTQLLAASSSSLQLRINMKEGSRWLVDVINSQQSISTQETKITSTSSEAQKVQAASEVVTSSTNYTRITDLGTENDSAICEVMKVLNGQFCVCSMGTLSQLRKEEVVSILKMDLQQPLEIPYRPHINEMVAVYVENPPENIPKWQRGIVLAEVNGSYSLALVDFGSVVVSNNMKKLPAELKKCPLLAVKLCLKSCSPVRLEEGDILKVALQKRLTDVQGWEAKFSVLRDDSQLELGLGQLCAWKVTADEADQLPSVPLHSGNRVTISSFHDINSIYVRPVTIDYLNLYQCLSQELAAECIRAGSLEREPFMGELVAALWNEDGNYYRAQIVGKTSEKKQYKVVFVDYGNYENVHSSKMKSMSSKLKSKPSCAIKVGLKDMADTTISSAALEYGTKLAETEELLLIEFERLDAVQLSKLSNKTNINREINALMKPSRVTFPVKSFSPAIQRLPRRQDLPDPEPFEIGEPTQLVITHVPIHKRELTDNGKMQVVAIPASTELIISYTETMSSHIKQYVESLPGSDFHIPRSGELCICSGVEDPVSKEKSNLRAECVRIINEKTVLLEFIDVGSQKEVSFNMIHRMTRELMQYPALALYCYVEGLPTNVSYEKFCDLINGLGSCQVIVRKFDGEHYTIHIPELVDMASNK